VPSLPVLSATSCSTQAPRGASGGSKTSVSLSRPRSASSPIDRGAEPQGGVLLGGHVGAAGHSHGAHAVEQPLEVDADEGGRDHAEEAEGRVPAADVAGVHEDGAEALVEGLLLERGALVGDGHEVMTGVLAVELAQALVEVGVEARRLGGAAGLAGDHEQRALEVDGRRDGGHGGRVGGIEHVQVEVARPRAEDGAHDLGRQAGAAHAEQDRGAVPLGAQLVHELGESLDLVADALEDAEPAEGVGDDLLVGVVVGLPQRGVGRPETLREVGRGERHEALLHGGLEFFAAHVSLLRRRAGRCASARRSLRPARTPSRTAPRPRPGAGRPRAPCRCPAGRAREA